MKRKLFLLIVMLLAGLLAACGGSSSQSGVTATPSAGTISATISGLGALKGPFAAYGIAADDTAVWVHNGDTGTLLRIDPKTNALVATIPVGLGPGGVAIGEGAVWVAGPASAILSRIDPQTNKVVAIIPLALNNEASVAVSPGAVWVTDAYNSSLVRIDPRTNQVVATIPNQLGPTDLSFGAGSAWLSNRHDTSKGLERLDPQTNQVQARIDVGSDHGLACTAVVALAQTVWTVDLVLGDGSSVVLKRIDPATNTIVAAIPVPGVVPFHFAADEQVVWVWGPDAGLLRIDAHTNRVVGELAMKGGAGVALGAGSVWFAKSDGTLLRITPAS
jgi:YVTN family beta-propeller protein